MDHIKIPVISLYEKAKLMLDEGMDTVELRMMDAEGEGEYSFPACIHFEGFSKDEPISTDYEDIESL